MKYIIFYQQTFKILRCTSFYGFVISIINTYFKIVDTYLLQIIIEFSVQV